ncbi:MAG: bis(5'-nucleosyl)-tetraphosphatase (symmetrical) YqeK [Oscillospiraceae bacterium]|nr:bis(5'-nucleosyl)-tetraphosphatase (symmetrical) YqeK [Oscillospiraceae bacterium]
MRDKTAFYIEFISGRLSEKRFVHSVKTAEMCRELALKHGYNDPEKAYITGILHDVCKEAQADEIKKLISSKLLKKPEFALDPLEKEEPKLWHAPAGAVYIREILGIDDDEMFSAIRFHTVARAKMTKLEKIIYLGDLVAFGREYPEVQKYRDFALADLNTGMLHALVWALAEDLERKKQISLNTHEAYNYYLY